MPSPPRPDSPSGAPARVNVRHFADRVATDVPTFEVDLTPMAREAGIAYLHDVYLDAGRKLATGDRVRLRDEGGALWDGEVETRQEDSRGLGHKYRLRIQPSASRPVEMQHVGGQVRRH